MVVDDSRESSFSDDRGRKVRDIIFRKDHSLFVSSDVGDCLIKDASIGLLLIGLLVDGFRLRLATPSDGIVD
jgi:hypothetical protein